MPTISIPAQHPSFKGHFPNYPVLPAVVLLDFLNENFKQYCLSEHLPAQKITGIKKMKFTGMIKPGDHIDVNWTIKKTTMLKATIFKDEEKIADGSFLIEKT